MVLAEALLRVPDAADRRPVHRGQARPGRLASITRRDRAPSSSTPRPGRSASPRASSSPARRRKASSASSRKRIGLPAVRAATRQAMRADGQPFRARRDHRGRRSSARGRTREGASLFVRHAGRRRAHRRRCAALLRFLCRGDRGDRPRRRRRAAAGPARHLREAVGAASALRGGEPRARDGRAGAARHRRSRTQAQSATT